ncbi:hypothetical protein QUF80_02005 [Desulfococcaceae bacterium HSG8]|nr:hypothetical protein [Desulfococcaceae bacterium HSG8]
MSKNVTWHNFVTMSTENFTEQNEDYKTPVSDTPISAIMQSVKISTSGSLPIILVLGICLILPHDIYAMCNFFLTEENI